MLYNHESLFFHKALIYTLPQTLLLFGSEIFFYYNYKINDITLGDSHIQKKIDSSRQSCSICENNSKIFCDRHEFTFFPVTNFTDQCI